MIDDDDMHLIKKALKSVKKLKASFWKALCHIKICWRKDKEIKAMHGGVDTFDGCLDIRSLVDVRANLNILLHLTLTAKQQFLFFNHRGRNITLKDDSSDSEDASKLSDLLKEPDYWNITSRFDEAIKEKSGYVQSILKDYQACNELDYKLLKGILPKERFAKRRSRNNLNIVNINLPQNASISHLTEDFQNIQNASI